MNSKRSPVDLPAILARIEARLDALDMSADAASREAGKPDAIRNLRRAVADNRRTGITTGTIVALAPVLKTSPSWLLEGMGEEDGDAPSRPRQADLVGYVSAGSAATLYAESQGPFDTVDAPEGSTEHTVAVEVRGTSLGPVLDQWLVFYDRVEDPPNENLAGKLCVVGLPDGRVLVKQLRKARSNGLWHLYSNYADEPILDQEVVWAAPVRAMTPRG